MGGMTRAGALAFALLFAAGEAAAEIRVGITVSASGPGSSLSQPQMKSVATLPKEIAGEPVTYIALDDESDSTKAAQNARKLIQDSRIDVLIGSSLTPVSLPLLDIAAENKVPLLTMAASSVLVAPMDGKRRWTFKVVPNDDIMAAAILKHIAKTGVRTLGYIGVADSYGEGYYKVLSDLAPGLGVTLTGKETYGRGDTSVLGQVLRVLATKPDAVFVASAGSPAVLPQTTLRARGFSGPIFQTHGIATNDFMRLGGKDAEGAMFAGEAYTVAEDLAADDPFRKVTAAYIEAYRKTAGEAPVIFGAHLYDSMELVRRAVPAALKTGKPGTPEFRAALRDALEETRDLHLNNGLANMSPTDHNGYDERSAFLIKVQDGRFRLMK